MSFRTTAALILFTFGFTAGATGQDAGSAVFVDNSRVLKCTPKILKGDQPLVLTLGPTHGQDLAIRRVAGNIWFDLIMASPPPPMKSLMSRKQFSEAHQLVLPMDTVGYHWDDHTGKGTGERIFSKPGRYIVYTSDNLESEDPGNKCTLNYAPSANPAAR
jgi:hypothetical protein